MSRERRERKEQRRREWEAREAAMEKAERELPNLMTSEDIIPHLWSCFNGTDHWVFLSDYEDGYDYVHHLAVCCLAVGMDVKWGYVGWRNMFPEQKATVMFLTIPKTQFGPDDVNCFMERTNSKERVAGTGKDVITLQERGGDPHRLLRFMKSIRTGEHRAITAERFSHR
jgi:hypothetical protein